MVVSIEYGATDDVLTWANNVVKANPHRRVIILTHAYMADDNTRQGANDRSNPRLEVFGEANNGEDMWEKLIKRHANIFLVMCGHKHSDEYSYLTSTGIHGNQVHQVLANYQHMDNGGNGNLVIMKFIPGEDRIHLKTSSPYLKKYLDTNELNLTYEMKRK